jgi:myo-inositol-1(or 4)-monophosphatase
VTDSLDRASDLELARAAILAAGEVVLAYFQSDLEVRFKSADQPVTVADLAADRILRERLVGARPDYGWLSEESAASPDRLQRRRLWVVDPIDGTNSFVEGIPEFVISVGLVEDESPVLGILLNPITGELYHALRGGGAFRNDSPITVAPRPPAGERPRLVASRWEAGLGEFNGLRAEWDIQLLGSTAYRMARVAEGAAHAFFSRSQKNEWDVCAATLLVHEAGGCVTQSSGSPLRFNQPVPSFDGVVCTGTVPVQLPDGPYPGGGRVGGSRG